MDVPHGLWCDMFARTVVTKSSGLLWSEGKAAAWASLGSATASRLSDANLQKTQNTINGQRGISQFSLLISTCRTAVLAPQCIEVQKKKRRRERSRNKSPKVGRSATVAGGQGAAAAVCERVFFFFVACGPQLT